MRNTTAVVTFDFTFTYPRKGIFEQANSITVCEPSYEKRAVHRRMASTVMEAVHAYQRLAAADAAAAQMPSAPRPSEPSEQADGEQKDVASRITADVLMIILRAGMKTDDFVRFCDWVQKELTDCKQLAYVGTDPDDKNPVFDLVWESIVKEGGVEAIDRVIGEFSRFFLGLNPSRTSSGISSSSSSEAKPPASSRTKRG
jgi:hypothetical protein